MRVLLRRRSIGAAALSILGLGAGLLVHSPASLAQTSDAGPFTTTSCKAPILGDWPTMSLITISGDFPDQVTAGTKFTVSNVKVAIDMQYDISAGPTVEGPILDLGPFGKMTLPDAEINGDGYAIFQGKSSYSIGQVTLTAPATAGANPIKLKHINFDVDSSPLIRMDCDLDPETSVLATVNVAAAPTTTTTTVASTSSQPTPTTAPATPGGTANPATPVRANPNYTG